MSIKTLLTIKRIYRILKLNPYDPLPQRVIKLNVPKLLAHRVEVDPVQHGILSCDLCPEPGPGDVHPRLLQQEQDLIDSLGVSGLHSNN